MFIRLLKTIGKQWHGFVFLKIILMSGVLENVDSSVCFYVQFFCYVLF